MHTKLHIHTWVSCAVTHPHTHIHTQYTWPTQTHTVWKRYIHHHQKQTTASCCRGNTTHFGKASLSTEELEDDVERDPDDGGGDHEPADDASPGRVRDVAVRRLRPVHPVEEEYELWRGARSQRLTQVCQTIKRCKFTEIDWGTVNLAKVELAQVE